MLYNKSRIMTAAWVNHRKHPLPFGEALHRAWLSEKARPINEMRIASAKAAAGITEPTDTWAGWRAQGFEVIHGSKALFGADLIYGSRGDGAIYKARFFGASQVQALQQVEVTA
jgi:hypothetical protein